MGANHTEEDDDSSSPSRHNNDENKNKSSHNHDNDKDLSPSPSSSPKSDDGDGDSSSPKSAPSKNDSAPSSKSNDSLSSPSSPPSELSISSPPLLLSPLLLSSPAHKDLSPSPPPPPLLSSPLPPPPSPSPPPPSPLSPPLLQPSLLSPLQSFIENSSPPPNYYASKHSQPLSPSLRSRPQFYAPPPDRPNLPHNDSSPGASNTPKSGHHGLFGAANLPGSSGDDSVKYIGYTLVGIFAVAFVSVAVALAFVFKKKKSRADAYFTPYMPPVNIHVKSGANGHYYVQQPLPSPPVASNTYGIGNINNAASSKHHIAASFDSTFKSVQIVFTYEMVMEMTNSFSSQNLIGEGGFGRVYKGLLHDGKAVAVKQLKVGSGQREREFKVEVDIISRVHHRHLVPLVGYCISEKHRILVYEYVPNGTLHDHLHVSGMPVLEWDKRLKIAIGAAKGLAYMHEDCSQKIIHRDIKSANILLDHAYEAQVADFGLARLADAANSHVSTRVVGSFGYMAPEYATSGKLTDRADVFSFGVVLLELVTGRKPVDKTQPLGDESLVAWARPLLHRAIERRDFSDLIDPRLQNQFVESEMFRMIEAAAACVRHSAPRRPRMVQVVRALDCGDENSGLSNGVKYGDSMHYDSGQYDKEISIFRRMVNGTFVDSDFDMYSGELSLSRDTSMTSRGSQQELMRHSSSGESETRVINMHRNSLE